LSAFYAIDEVAAHLKLHVKTVRQYVRDGRLKATRIGKQYRVAAADLDAFMGQTDLSGDASPHEHRLPEVSSIVEVDAVDRDASMRLTNALMAAANSPRKRDGPPLRIETLYDEARSRLKVIIVGGIDANIYLLKLIAGYSASSKFV
jgi:excisionase family DNA binding protein